MVCLVRSEDRKPSKRVFPLLQNLDLDTVTFEQVQGVGDPITIEDMNEQELQDLVLVNLARLAVSGEWTGLLEAGGGGAPNTGGYVSDYWYCPAGNMSAGTSWVDLVADKIYLLPIWVTADMTLEAIAVYGGGIAGSLRLGIYNYNSTGLGGTLLADAGTGTSPSAEWKIISGLSTTVSQGHYFLAIQSDGALPVNKANTPYSGGGGSYNQIPFSTTEATPGGGSFGMMRYDVSYATGFSDLTLVTPDAFDYNQVVIVMRPA